MSTYAFPHKMITTTLAAVGAILSLVMLSGEHWVSGDVSFAGSTASFDFGIATYTTTGKLGNVIAQARGEIAWCFDEDTPRDDGRLYVGDGKQDCDKSRGLIALAVMGGVFAIAGAALTLISSVDARWAFAPAAAGALFSGVAMACYPKDDVCALISRLSGVPMIVANCDYGRSRVIAIFATVLTGLAAIVALTIPAGPQTRPTAHSAPLLANAIA